VARSLIGRRPKNSTISDVVTSSPDFHGKRFA
jgi:hypothetical protein